jgi:sugar phosphate isomerase/epimerase
MKISQVAVQLYTLRESCTNESDFARTLNRVREIGYRAVQVSGVSADIPVDTIRRLLEERELICCATHENGDLIRRSPVDVADRLDALNCKITAYPFPANVDFDSEESVASLISDLDRAGAVLASRGQALCYHNHAHEFFRVGGRTILDRIYAETNPAHLAAELDTFWVQAGGADPVAWIQRVSGRMPIVHLKDYRVLPDGTRDFAEIGNGNLDWKSIIAACDAAGVQWFCVEQDVCPADPFDSVRQSFEFLRDNLASC